LALPEKEFLQKIMSLLSFKFAAIICPKRVHLLTNVIGLLAYLAETVVMQKNHYIFSKQTN